MFDFVMTEGQRNLRDIRLSMIWVGTSEVMQMIVQGEWYKEQREAQAAADVRDVERDAPGAQEEGEKVFE